jgi:methylphosphotriester-DNA--protein-cysteine methyltransferase
VTARRLHPQFLAELGVSLPGYKRIVRVAKALQQMGTTEIEAVTIDVGYRSKKNLYRSLRSLTGLTPTAFRKLPPEAVERLVQKLWAKVKV